MKSYKIHLIRHGRTQANEEGLYVGRTDLPLSPGGLNALLALREGGGYPTAGRFFTSPLTRCRQTLEVLYPGCRQEVVEGLAECDFGDWDGRSVAELGGTERRFSAAGRLLPRLDRRQAGGNSRRRGCGRFSAAGHGGIRGAGAGAHARRGYRGGGMHPRRRYHDANGGLCAAQGAHA